MKRSVMITTLFNGDPADKMRYYFSNDENRAMYCDALLPAEASSKYILANHHVDEIVVLGSRSTYDPGDELVPMVLRDGKSFYASEISELSNYSLFRYRLAEFLDEIKIEEQDIKDLLDEDEQKEVIRVLRAFFAEKVQPRGLAKFNRLFDLMVQNEEVRAELTKAITDAIPQAARESDRYRQWIRYYLYSELKDSNKYEILEINRDVTMRFVPADTSDNMSFAGRLADGIKALGADDAEVDEVEMFVCIQSEDANDIRMLINMIDIIKSMPNSIVKIAKILTTSRTSDAFASEITDDTALYGSTELIAGIRAFLQYGKTDMLVDYWNEYGTGNTQISRIIYAMRNIDVGISLCDISDIERGIASLRKLIREEGWTAGDNIAEKYFEIIIEGIKQDYGDLILSDEIRFIDLAKWAYRKGFWQQTLTLIESRAPRDFVKRGIYYYADSEETREEALRTMGQKYYDMKPYEKYRMRDISHYFVKQYGRYRVARTDNNDQHQKAYTNLRIKDLDDPGEDIPKAFTVCPDREALHDLLYAYYHLGDVRNATNHASDEHGGFMDIMSDMDLSSRMEVIKQAVDYFVFTYDRVADMIRDIEYEAIEISPEEVTSYSKTLIPPKTTRTRK